MKEVMAQQQHTTERYGVIFHHKNNGITKKLYTMKYNVAMVAIYADLYDPDTTNPATSASIYVVDNQGTPVILRNVVKRHSWM